MAEAGALDLGVLEEIGHQIGFGVGEVEQPGVRADAPHRLHRRHEQPDVAHGVDLASWPAVLALVLHDAMALGDFDVFEPKIVPVDLAGGDDVVAALQRLFQDGRGLDLDLQSLPLQQPQDAALGGPQPRLVDVHQGEDAAAQRLVVQGCRHRHRERGARAQHHNFKSFHACPSFV